MRNPVRIPHVRFVCVSENRGSQKRGGGPVVPPSKPTPNRVPGKQKDGPSFGLRTILSHEIPRTEPSPNSSLDLADRPGLSARSQRQPVAKHVPRVAQTNDNPWFPLKAVGEKWVPKMGTQNRYPKWSPTPM